MFLRDQLIINKSALVQVMDWRERSDKPLPESMMTPFTATYIHQHAPMGYENSYELTPIYH